jgi:hypothetical protein
MVFPKSLESTSGDGFPIGLEKSAPKLYKKMVRGAGLEPAQYCYRQDLNLVRLPISPPALLKQETGVLCSAESEIPSKSVNLKF